MNAAVNLPSMILFEHAGGHAVVAAEGDTAFTDGDPRWVRNYPVEVRWPASFGLDEEESLRQALRRAKTAVDDAHLGTRAVIAILNKIDLADVVAASECHSDDYDLVHAVEHLLAHTRDVTSSESDALCVLLDRPSHATGDAQ